MRAASRFRTTAILLVPMFATACAIVSSAPKAASASTDTVSVGSASVVEGNTGAARTVSVWVTLATPATSTSSVTATLAPGSATAGTKSPADYKAWSAAKTLTFATGQTAKTLSVSVLPDTTVEPNETATITLSNPSSGLSLGIGSGTITIVNDDTSPATTTNTVSVGSASVAEGDTGGVRAVYARLTLATPATSAVSVKATLTPGSATAGTKSPAADYKAWSAAKTLTFTTGQIAKNLSVSVLPDTTYEPDETATITLSSPSSGLALGVSTGTITIVNDDASPATGLGSISVSPATPSIAVGTSQQFTATGNYSDSSTKDLSADVTWSSSAPSVASITSSGLATANAAGSATITATLGSVARTTTLTGAANTCPTAKFPDLSNVSGAGTGYAKPQVSVSCSSTQLKMSSNGMPSYTFVPMTPNPLKTQNWNWAVPLHPAVASSATSVSTWFGTVGFTTTGLPIYAAMEGAQPANEAYGDPIYNNIVDGCKGHTGPAGEYHLHAYNVGSSCGFGSNNTNQVIGYALDGFPIYAPTGCLDSACNQVVTFQSGWVRTGTPTTNAWSNYKYVASSDPTVLDQCNGRIGPDGTYRYYATSGFPYTFGCFKGTPTKQS